MILFFYQARMLFRYSCLLLSVFLMLFWLRDLSRLIPLKTSNDGEPLGFATKILLATAKSLPRALEFDAVILMLSTVITLVILGRRAELHVMRGTGLSGLKILSGYMLTAAAFTLALTLIIEPLSYSATNWAHRTLSPNVAATSRNAMSNRTAWVTVNDAAVQGRLSGYDPVRQTAESGYLINFGTGGLGQSYSKLEQIEISDLELAAVAIDLEGAQSDLRLSLDRAPRLQPISRIQKNLPLPILLGWGDNPDRLALAPRFKTYLILSTLAKPLLAAALVLISGTLCIGIGTRQQLGMLIFGTLSIVVLAYSLSVVTQAFGLNGKLTPAIAAFGPPLMLLFLGLGILFGQDLHWILGKRRSRAG